MQPAELINTASLNDVLFLQNLKRQPAIEELLITRQGVWVGGLSYRIGFNQVPTSVWKKVQERRSVGASLKQSFLQGMG